MTSRFRNVINNQISESPASTGSTEGTKALLRPVLIDLALSIDSESRSKH